MSIEHEPPILSIQSVGFGLSGVVGATWLGWLPPVIAAVASLFAVVWYAIQIWESRTVKRWRHAAGWPVPLDDEQV